MKKFLIPCLIVFFLIVCVISPYSFADNSSASPTLLEGKEYEVVQIVNNGPKESKISIVLAGEGYDKTEQDIFISQCKSFLEEFFTVEPMKSYKTSFNVFAVKCVSNVSTCGTDKANDTFFEMYKSMDLNKKIDNAYIFTALAKKIDPNYKSGAIICNKSDFGENLSAPKCLILGSTKNDIDYMTDVFIHEFGHNFAGLLDEYKGGLQGENAVNVTKNIDKETVKWKAYFSKGADLVPVSDFSGNLDPQWFRPYKKCYMYNCYEKDLSFCPVCEDFLKETIIKLISTTRRVSEASQDEEPAPSSLENNTPNTTPSSIDIQVSPSPSPSEEPIVLTQNLENPTSEYIPTTDSESNSFSEIFESIYSEIVKIIALLSSTFS